MFSRFRLRAHRQTRPLPSERDCRSSAAITSNRATVTLSSAQPIEFQISISQWQVARSSNNNIANTETKSPAGNALNPISFNAPLAIGNHRLALRYLFVRNAETQPGSKEQIGEQFIPSHCIAYVSNMTLGVATLCILTSSLPLSAHLLIHLPIVYPCDSLLDKRAPEVEDRREVSTC